MTVTLLASHVEGRSLAYLVSPIRCHTTDQNHQQGDGSSNTHVCRGRKKCHIELHHTGMSRMTDLTLDNYIGVFKITFSDSQN